MSYAETMDDYPPGLVTVINSKPPVIAAIHFPEALGSLFVDLIHHPIRFVSVDEACHPQVSVLLVGPNAGRGEIGDAIRLWFSEGDNRPLLVCTGNPDLTSWLESREMDRLVWATIAFPPGPRERRIILRAVESSHGEVSRLRQSLVSLEVRHRGLQDLARKLRWDASTCPLTGVFNRRAIESFLEDELARTSTCNPLAVGLVDIDRFRETNKQHLHTGGDLVLHEVARVMASSIRESDALGRIGGDEFLIVARNTGLEGAAILAERIRQNIENTEFSCMTGITKATVSIGFAVAEAGNPVTVQKMKEQAAKALLDAKESGRNRAVISLASPKNPQDAPAPI